jgi:putative ABC transport system permease protein
MILTAFRDLQHRRKRIAIAVIGTSLVLALSVAISGIAAAFGVETSSGVAQFGATGWIRPDTAIGSLNAATPFQPEELLQTLEATEGVTAAEPITFRTFAIGRRQVDQLTVFGVVPQGFGSPKPLRGAALAGPGEAVVDETLGRKVGDEISLGKLRLRVVGVVRDRSLLAGQSTVYIDISDAQQINYAGQQLASSVIVQGGQLTPPSGFAMDSNTDVEQELLLPLQQAIGTINMIRGLLWLVAALIIGSVIYLQALERTRDFAVMKATGSSSRAVAMSLVIQAVVLALVASLIAAIVATIIAPLFPMRVEIPTSAYIILPIVSLCLGLLACLSGLRRCLSVAPAIALRGAQ